MLAAFDIPPEPRPVFEGELEGIVVGLKPPGTMCKGIHHFHFQTRPHLHQGLLKGLGHSHMARPVAHGENKDARLMTAHRFHQRCPTLLRAGRQRKRTTPPAVGQILGLLDPTPLFCDTMCLPHFQADAGLATRGRLKGLGTAEAIKTPPAEAVGAFVGWPRTRQI